MTGGKSFTEEVTEFHARRTPLYHQAAQYEFETDQLTPEQVTEEIVEVWRK